MPTLPPLPQPYTYCSETDIQNLLSSAGELSRVDDAGDGSTPPLSPQFIQAAAYATDRVLAACQRRYDDVDLATSTLCNEWATVIAAAWLCSRRGNPVPESIQALLDATLKDLEDVKAARLDVPRVGTRNASGPRWSNVRIDARYPTKQIRVERPNSERTPTQYPQTVDEFGDYQEM